jgi:hypothetical protein
LGEVVAEDEEMLGLRGSAASAMAGKSRRASERSFIATSSFGGGRRDVETRKTV